jgi:DNA-binding PadR family transcriptional regulator
MSSDKRSKKNRFSSEYTMLSILEYLYVNSQKTPVSKYNIVNNTSSIKQQRPDRVTMMMDSLENNGFITLVNTLSNVKFYKITERGIEAYERWVKYFLEFATSTNTANRAKDGNNKKQ